MKFMF
jgi:hypothetical protein